MANHPNRSKRSPIGEAVIVALAESPIIPSYKALVGIPAHFIETPVVLTASVVPQRDGYAVKLETSGDTEGSHTVFEPLFQLGMDADSLEAGFKENFAPATRRGGFKPPFATEAEATAAATAALEWARSRPVACRYIN